MSFSSSGRRRSRRLRRRLLRSRLGPVRASPTFAPYLTNMKLRTLHNDLTVSRVCLGTMTFGGQTDGAAAARMLNIAFDRGVNFLDTANVYTAGESERILGHLLGARRMQL